MRKRLLGDPTHNCQHTNAIDLLVNEAIASYGIGFGLHWLFRQAVMVGAAHEVFKGLGTVANALNSTVAGVAMRAACIGISGAGVFYYRKHYGGKKTISVASTLTLWNVFGLGSKTDILLGVLSLIPKMYHVRKCCLFSTNCYMSHNNARPPAYITSLKEEYAKDFLYKYIEFVGELAVPMYVGTKILYDVSKPLLVMLLHFIGHGDKSSYLTLWPLGVGCAGLAGIGCYFLYTKIDIQKSLRETYPNIPKETSASISALIHQVISAVLPFIYSVPLYNEVLTHLKPIGVELSISILRACSDVDSPRELNG